ncbi:sialate O-acetylesterase [Weissella confusa]|uniref:sialate O-acetylesterase n=1 Tax=Weissella confusa TaxID=1583 RepID=UPI001081B7B9|nr:sialate O-acetylesterase [Weissella confusa]MED4272176.1 sialate O-acetylesterase [Weissella confusa]TGE70951.1 hypothetical protein C6P15_02460 [Weissella confusa]
MRDFKLKLADYFQNGVVIQRDEKGSIWGSGHPNQAVSVLLDGEQIGRNVADEHGDWQVDYEAVAADGRSHRIAVMQGDDVITLTDVHFGDVYLLAGQSNMQIWMGRLKERYHHEIEKADYPSIRSFQMTETVDFVTEHTNPAGKWIKAVPNEINDMSGVGYFMAKNLFLKQDVPIGLISSAIGGTPIEAWLADDEIQRLKLQTADYDQLRDDAYVADVKRHEGDAINAYSHMRDDQDLGLQKQWHKADQDFTTWDEVPLTAVWPEAFRMAGVTWLHKTIRLPETVVGQLLELRLGTLTDADQVFVNGQQIGETGYMYPPRNYEFVAQTAEIEIVIRLKIDQFGGGFTRGKRHVIVDAQKNEVIDLDTHGLWHIKRGTPRLSDAPTQTFFQYKPSGLFNGMIAPLTKLALSGVVYYQGESNDTAPNNYSQKLVALVNDWRRRWHKPELPFAVVQLPNFGLTPERDWTTIRAEQQIATQQLTQTELIVTIDVGEYNELHPLQKAPVGQRVADTMNHLVYGETTNRSPLAVGAHRHDDQIMVSFDIQTSFKQVDEIVVELLESDGWKRRTALIGLDGLIIQATGEVERVRYAWSVNPTATLFTVNGVPVAPFDLVIAHD